MPANKRSKSPDRSRSTTPTSANKKRSTSTKSPKLEQRGGSGALSQLTANVTYGRNQHFNYKSYADLANKQVTLEQAGGGLSGEDDDVITISNSTLCMVAVAVVLGLLGYMVYSKYTEERTAREQAEIALQAAKDQSAQLDNKLKQINTGKLGGVGRVRRGSNEGMQDIVAHPDLGGYRMVGPDADNPSLLSYWGYLTNKAYERVINPLLPPERSYENTYGIPINMPSRDFPGGFQQIGYLYRERADDPSIPVGQNSESVIIPLFGQPVYPGANKWNYYITSDKYSSIKMPFDYRGKMTDDEHGVDEIYDGDDINIKAYNSKFKVKIYKYDKPRYITYVY